MLGEKRKLIMSRDQAALAAMTGRETELSQRLQACHGAFIDIVRVDVSHISNLNQRYRFFTVKLHGWAGSMVPPNVCLAT